MKRCKTIGKEFTFLLEFSKKHLSVELLIIMIKLPFLCKYLEELLDNPKIVDYCPNGLQIEGSEEINKVATAVTASLKTIEAAIESGAQVLFVHHGIVWSKDNPVITGVKRKKIKLCLDHNLSIICYHLPLDCHREFGNNWKAAQEMGWKDLQPFCNVNGIFYGVKGTVNNIPRDEFQIGLESYYKHPAYSVLGGPSTIKSAALVSGGAHRNITDAVLAGVDCYITGSFDEPIWHIATEEKINFFAMGHSATETIGPKALGEHLKTKFGLEHQFLDLPNPF